SEVSLDGVVVIELDPQVGKQQAVQRVTQGDKQPPIADHTVSDLDAGVEVWREERVAPLPVDELALGVETAGTITVFAGQAPAAADERIADIAEVGEWSSDRGGSGECLLGDRFRHRC